MVIGDHEYAVRRVRFSPHEESVIASVSYDMTMKIHDVSTGSGRCMVNYDRHTEFVFGVDFSLFEKGVVACAAWDERVDLVRF